MTILKALKDRIRSMGGETNATNIADAIKDLPKGGSSELPPEVENAIETGGMGWTDEDETVHKIDEKYIPSSGGVTVVKFDVDFDRTVTADKTVAEVKEAIRTKPVIGLITMTIAGVMYVANAFGDAGENGQEVAFAAFAGDSLSKIIASEDDDWVLTIG